MWIHFDLLEAIVLQFYLLIGRPFSSGNSIGSICYDNYIESRISDLELVCPSDGLSSLNLEENFGGPNFSEVPLDLSQGFRLCVRSTVARIYFYFFRLVTPGGGARAKPIRHTPSEESLLLLSLYLQLLRPSLREICRLLARWSAGLVTSPITTQTGRFRLCDRKHVPWKTRKIKQKMSRKISCSIKEYLPGPPGSYRV